MTTAVKESLPSGTGSIPSALDQHAKAPWSADQEAPRRSWHRAFLLASILIATTLLVPSTSQAFDYAQRSISRSQQFIIYCPDVGLRLAVSGFVETTKEAVLQTLGIGDHWKLPIVIDMERSSTTNPNQPLCMVRLLNTDGGSKVEVDLILRAGQFKEIRFPQQIIRAVLLELAYRDRPQPDGSAYAEPPGWLVEALAQKLAAGSVADQPNAALFKQLIETGRLPKIREFLKGNVGAMDSTSRAIYGTCASSLLEMLIALPDGQADLARMARATGRQESDPATILLNYFPALGGNEITLEKWWTLGLARFSASDRYLPLSVADTDSHLGSLLTLQVVTDEKTGKKTPFVLDDYKQFIKLRTARAALLVQESTIAALLPHAHPLLRPVVTEYERIVDDLSHGKTRHIDAALAEASNYRSMIVERMDRIEDYLNWFEATQIPDQSGAFDGYLRAAATLDKALPPKRDDAISRYVDQIAREFE